MKKRFSLVALIAVFALIVAACSSDTEDTTTTTVPAEEPADTSVLDLAVEAGQFSVLIAALEATGLDETLAGEGPFTVLAPTDAAFADALEALGLTAEELLANPALSDILLYHVLGQAADSSAVAALDGSSVATVQGEEISISVESGTIFINETAEVVSADLTADNGIVHVINQVILPPTIAEALGVAAPEETTTTTEAPEETTTTTEAMTEPTIAEIVVELAGGDPAEFTTLLAAIEAADPAVLDTLSDASQELTVFAPTDAAFAAIPEDVLAGILADQALLTNILLYHVAPGVFLAEDVVAAAPIEALPTLLDGSTLSIEVVDGAVVINGEATVIQTDVVASNGVIHVIDTVLQP